MATEISVTVGSTTGIDFLESCVGQTVTVPEFKGHLENNALAFWNFFPRYKNKLKGAKSGE